MADNLFAVPDPVGRLQLEVTTGCNLGCAGCQRTIAMEAKRWRNSHMPIERYRAVIANAPRARLLVLQGIGEPTLHPKIDEMVDIARASGRFDLISFNTNALVRDTAFYRDLAARGLSHVSVSVDSLDPALAEELRAGTDVGRLKSAIRDLVRLFPGLTISTVLSRRNLAGYRALVDEVAALGPRFFEVQPLISYTAASDPVCLDQDDTARARAVLAGIRQARPDLTVIPAAALTPSGARCRRPFRAVYVTVEGYLTPCCTTNDVDLFGRTSLAEMSFAEAWSRPAVARWLSGFFDADADICRGCAFNPAGSSTVHPATGRAVALQQAGDFAGAEALLRDALREGDGAELLHRLGISRLARGAPEEAARLIDGARTLSPDPRRHYNAGVALCQAGRLDEAHALAEEMARLWPADPRAASLMAEVLRARLPKAQAAAAARSA